MRHTETIDNKFNYKLRPHAKPRTIDWDYFKSDPNDSIPAEKVLPELLDDTLRPANILCGVRYRKNMTQKELAKQLGISVRRLSEMENAKRPIGKEMAQKLATVLKVDRRKFL